MQTHINDGPVLEEATGASAKHFCGSNQSADKAISEEEDCNVDFDEDESVILIN